MKYLGYITVIIILILFIYYFVNLGNTVNYKEYPFGNDILINEKKTINNYTLRITTLLEYPQVIKLYPLLTKDESKHLISIGGDEFKRSTVTGDKKFSADRTSNSYFIPRNKDSIIIGITNRIAKLLKVDPCQLESLQVVRYFPGEKFKNHYDWFTKDVLDKTEEKRGGQRIYTIFAYLNNIPNENDNTKSGYTCFPKLDLCIKPQEGLGIFWKNTIGNKTCYQVFHSGTAPKYGIKYGLNIWVRERCFT